MRNNRIEYEARGKENIRRLLPEVEDRTRIEYDGFDKLHNTWLCSAKSFFVFIYLFTKRSNE